MHLRRIVTACSNNDPAPKPNEMVENRNRYTLKSTGKKRQLVSVDSLFVPRGAFYGMSESQYTKEITIKKIIK